MSFIWFLLFAILSAVIGPIITGFSRIPGSLLGFVNKNFTLIGIPLEYYCWVLASTTGVLVADKYSEGILVYILYLLIVFFLQIVMWKNHLVTWNKIKQRGGLVVSRTHDLVFKSQLGLKWAIVISIILFGIKPNYAPKFLSFIFDLI